MIRNFDQAKAVCVKAQQQAKPGIPKAVLRWVMNEAAKEKGRYNERIKALRGQLGYPL